MINELEFFNEVTLRICSSLDINEVAQACLDYLERFIPLDGLTISYYDEKKRSVIMMAIRSKIPLNTWKTVIPISEKGHKAFRTHKETVMIINNPDDYIVHWAIGKALGLVEKSSIVLFPWNKGHRLGHIDFFCKGRNRYTEEHAHLVNLLYQPFSIAMANSLQYQEIVNMKDLFSQDIQQMRHEQRQLSEAEIIGANGGLQNIMITVNQVAQLTTPVLLLGETGVGKEIIANSIHYSSPRREGPFVKINCGAIPETLVDSELFGHEKGAFTGAISRILGRFERAHQGTIFLDEIGDLPFSAQAKLLRVIQEKEIERVGGTEPINVNVRIVAATNRNLESLVQEGSFRKDLWFRLNVFPIRIPPLRERKQDIPVLVHYFIMRKSRELNLHINPELKPNTMRRLVEYNWPGNVRELQNIVERALINSRITDPSQPLSFDEFFLPLGQETKPILPESDGSILSLDQAMKQHIQRALTITKGKIYGKGGAAELLEINANTLRHRMRLLGIPYRKEVSEKFAMSCQWGRDTFKEDGAVLDN